MSSHGEAKERALKFNEATDTALELESNERKLRANDYVQDRGIFQRGAADNLNHLDFFGECYLQALQQLNEDDTWLHIGPGNFCAEVDYFTSPLFLTHARVVSNVYCLSQSPQAVTNLEFLKRHEKFNCIEGVKFQDLRDVFPVRAKVISDVFAAGSYDHDLFGFFQVASELLVPGGMLAVVLATVSFNSLNGASKSASEVYQSLKGFEVINSTENSGWVFRRTDEAFVKPRAELVSFVAADPNKQIAWPIRRYKIFDNAVV
jgi:hypothetical protein